MPGNSSQARPRPDLGALGEVLAFLAGLVRLGDLGLQPDDPVGRGLRTAGLLHHRFDIGAIFRAKPGHVGAWAQVIFALGHAEAALHQIGDLLTGSSEALRHEDAEQIVGAEIGRVERIGVRAQRRSDRRRQRPLVGNRANGVEVGLGRRHARLVDRVRVQIGVVEVADPGIVAAGRRIGFQDSVDHLLGMLLAHFVGDVEAANRAAVGWNLGVLDPIAIGKGEEVVARLHALVHCHEIEARGADYGLRSRRFPASCRRWR
jgi:hypothetical protein